MNLLEILDKNSEEFVKFFGISTENVSKETLDKIEERKFYLRHSLITAMNEELGQFDNLVMENSHD